MIHIEQAIKEAKSGGWKYPRNEPFKDWEKHFYQEAFLDPFFWQALGKARGWPEKSEAIPPPGASFQKMSDLPQHENHYVLHENWKARWHRFIDHLAEGKNAESFFKTLV